MDACWNGNFHHVMEDVLNQRWEWEKRDIWRAIGGFREAGFTKATDVINYTCSHDEVRPEHEIKYYSWNHIQRPKGMRREELALIKARLGLITLFGAPGIPMLYSGQEYGEDAPRTIDFLPLQWHKLQDPTHAQYYALVCRLIRARRGHVALRSDNIEFYADNFGEENVVRFKRWREPDDTNAERDFATVAVNFGQARRKIALDLPWNGRWRELVRNRLYTVNDGHFETNLAPWSAVFLVPERN